MKKLLMLICKIQQFHVHVLLDEMGSAVV